MMTGVAIVGAGHWGPHLIRNFSSLHGSQALWVIEKDERRRKLIGERFPGVQISDEISDALSDDRVDAIVIATPTSTHAPLVRESLEADKHVLVEKPLTADLGSAVELSQLAERKGLVLMVGHVFLFNAAVNSAKAYIDGGSLGDIRYLSMVRTNLGPVRYDVNAAWDLAAHDISIANYWLGGTPSWVSALGGSWVNEDIEDAVFITLKYPTGVLVHIEASWMNPSKRRLISVVGSEKMLTVDDMDIMEPLRLYDKGIEEDTSDAMSDTFAGFRAQIREGQVLIPNITAGEPLRVECEEFLARIRGASSSVVSDGWAGAAVVGVLSAADASMSRGGQLTEVAPTR
jgi:predicted dehydrogenase